MNPVLFALICYLGWGTADIFGTIASRKVGAITTTFYSYFISLLVSCLFVPFALSYLHTFTFGIVVLNFLLGVLFLASSVIFLEALRIGNASIVGTIAASFTALVVIFSIIFLKESVTFIQITAILIILIGVIITTLNMDDMKGKKLKIDKSILLAFTTMFLWGVYFTFIKIPIHHVGWFWANFIAILPFPLLLLYARNKGGIKIPSKARLLPICGNAFLSLAANYSFNFAITNGLTAIVAPIAGSYPTFFVFLARLIFKEPLKKLQIFGIILTLVGIICLGFVS